jgi:hypothetical protein
MLRKNKEPYEILLNQGLKDLKETYAYLKTLPDYEDNTLISNFPKEELELYQKAVELYGKDKVYIDTEAYGAFGIHIPDYYALKNRTEERTQETKDVLKYIANKFVEEWYKEDSNQLKK